MKSIHFFIFIIAIQGLYGACNEVPSNLQQAITRANAYYQSKVKMISPGDNFLSNCAKNQQVTQSDLLHNIHRAYIAINTLERRQLNDNRYLYKVVWSMPLVSHTIQQTICSLSDTKKDKTFYLPYELFKYIQEMLDNKLFRSLSDNISVSGTHYIERGSFSYIPENKEKGFSFDEQGYPFYDGKKIMTDDDIDLSWSLRLQINVYFKELRIRHLDYKEPNEELYEKIFYLLPDGKQKWKLSTDSPIIIKPEGLALDYSDNALVNHCKVQ